MMLTSLRRSARISGCASDGAACGAEEEQQQVEVALLSSPAPAQAQTPSIADGGRRDRRRGDGGAARGRKRVCVRNPVDDDAQNATASEKSSTPLVVRCALLQPAALLQTAL